MILETLVRPPYAGRSSGRICSGTTNKLIDTILSNLLFRKINDFSLQVNIYLTTFFRREIGSTFASAASSSVILPSVTIRFRISP